MVSSGCRDTSVRNYHYSLRKNPEENNYHKFFLLNVTQFQYHKDSHYINDGRI